MNRVLGLIYQAPKGEMADQASVLLEQLRNHEGAVYARPVFVRALTGGDAWGTLLSTEPMTSVEAAAFIDGLLG